MKRLALLIFVLGFSLNGISQSDSTTIKERKNILKWNITPFALIGPGSWVFSYERVLKNGQSFNVGAGLLKPKPRTNAYGETIQFFEVVQGGGYDLNADYRFFFKNRNANPAPDGLYWGPYTSLYHLNFEGASDIYKDGKKVNEVAIKTDFYMFNLGLQLGYQFIIKDRLAIDLYLVGPSYSHYNFHAQFDSETSLDKDGPFYNDFKKILSTILPGSESILDEVDFSTSGRAKINYVGYRYGIQIGYKF